MGMLETLDKLEAFYGRQKAGWPVEPYEFLLWWQCGYPPSEAACARGWEALQRAFGTMPDQILTAGNAKLARALKAGGLIPEVRAARLKEIATRVRDEFSGDLRAGLKGPVAEDRKKLKQFPGIADAGADRILLFGGLAPVAAVPSNCPQVLVRIRRGRGQEDYGASYRASQGYIEEEVPETFAARGRAYLLLKRHGQEVCKRIKPRCGQCPVSRECRYASEEIRDRGRNHTTPEPSAR